MSTVTAIPFVIDGVDFPDPGWANNLFAGPYFSTTSLKWFAIQKDYASPNSPLIYTSPDGITWTLAVQVTGTQSASTWFWDPLGPDPEKITFAIKAIGGAPTFYLQDYDCDTETLGAAYGAAGGPASSSTNRGFCISRLSNGTVKLFIVKSDQTLYYSQCSAGGVWSSVDTLIIANPGDANTLRVSACCTDRSGTEGAAFIYSYRSGGATQNFFYRYLSAANTLSAASQFLFTYTTNLSNAIGRIYQGSDNNLYVAELVYRNDAFTASGCGIWTISGTLSAPTKTETLIHDFTNGGVDLNFAPVFVFANELSSQPCLLCTLADSNVPPPAGGSNSTIYRFTYSGSWSTPELFIDLYTYPPTTPPPRVFNAPYYYLEGMSFLESSTSPGGLGTLITLEVEDVGIGSFVTTFSIVISPDLTLACPVGGGTGTLGAFYNKTMVRTGGTAPFTFTLISGQLPPGTTLNASTGNISGVLTAIGTFAYTIQVEDADGLTAETEAPCEVTVTGEIPPPPEFCETFPPPSYAPTYVLYDEPTELTGS